jgi:acylglycerol lipase
MSLMTNIITPDDGQAIQAVVCYCHGYTDFPTLTRRKELFRMVRKGIAVVIIEYEGHGRSDGYLGLITDWDKLIDDTSDFFEQTARRRFPSTPMFLMGESMGGAVAYCTYNRNPKLFSGVVFVCPMCKIGDDCLPPQWVIDLFRKLAGPKGTASTLGYLPIAPSQGIDIDLSVRPLKQAMLTAFPTDYVRKPRLATARELLDVTIHISNDLKNFDAPFLVQHGSLDRITDPKLSKSLYEESKSQDKTLRLYEGMFHSLLCGEFDENIDVVFNDSINWVLERTKAKMQ